jgi:hypothetical protein
MRVALVHDWLTGMRGGEKCLEVFCELYPQADLFALVYCPEKVSAVIRGMNIHTSWLNRLPGVERNYRYFLPLFPRAIEASTLFYDLILSVVIVSPREFSAARVAHRLHSRAHALCMGSI